MEAVDFSTTSSYRVQLKMTHRLQHYSNPFPEGLRIAATGSGHYKLRVVHIHEEEIPEEVERPCNVIKRKTAVMTKAIPNCTDHGWRDAKMLFKQSNMGDFFVIHCPPDDWGGCYSDYID